MGTLWCGWCLPLDPRHGDKGKGSSVTRVAFGEVSTMGTRQCKGSPSRRWSLPWGPHQRDKAKESSMTRVPFRWGPIMGTWQGDPLTQMGFEGQ